MAATPSQSTGFLTKTPDRHAPMDKGPTTRAAFEAHLQTLHGRTIETVTYYEIAYEGGEPAWSHHSPHIDSLDYGLTWTLDDGSLYSFIWGGEFTQYGVSVVSDALQFSGEVGVWEVSTRWQAWLGQEICETRVDWQRFDDRDHYPQSVHLTFRDAPTITVSAFEFHEAFEIGATDHITVFFRREDIPRSLR